MINAADGRKAIDYFEQAIKLEPNYAQAYAMAANVYGFLGALGQLHPAKAFDFVDRYSSKALEINNTIAEGYIAKACLYLFYEMKWEKAKVELQTALRLNPSAIEAHQLLWYYNIGIGKKEEAVTLIEKAMKLDPLSPILNNYLAEAYLYAYRYDEAIRQADRVLEINPQMRSAIEIKGWATGLKGDWQKALQLFEEVHRLVNHPLKAINNLGYAYARLGQPEKAQEYIAKIHQRQAEEPDAVLNGDLGMVMQHPAMKGIEQEDWYKEIRKKVEI